MDPPGTRARAPQPPAPRSARPVWEHFPHGADVGVRGSGATIAEAFAGAARALTAAACDLASVRPETVVEISCRAPTPELLLVDWLNAIVFEMATRRMLFADFDVRIDGLDLHALVRGESVDPARHQPAVEVKGATFTALEVSCDPGGRWTAQCVVDV